MLWWFWGFWLGSAACLFGVTFAALKYANWVQARQAARAEQTRMLARPIPINITLRRPPDLPPPQVVARRPRARRIELGG